jgi:hypothetical protein
MFPSFVTFRLMTVRPEVFVTVVEAVMGFSLFSNGWLWKQQTVREEFPTSLVSQVWPVAETLLFRVRPLFERPPFSVVLPGQSVA